MSWHDNSSFHAAVWTHVSCCQARNALARARRYSTSIIRWRRGRKWPWVTAWEDRNRRACLGDLNHCTCRFRRCEFPALLSRYRLVRYVHPAGPRAVHAAALSLSVTMRFGLYFRSASRRLKKRFAAVAFQRSWTGISSWNGSLRCHRCGPPPAGPRQLQLMLHTSVTGNML